MSDEHIFSSKYRGPYYLDEDTSTALESLADCLSCELTECESHSLLTIKYFESDDVIEATAIYLVASIAQNIEANLKIRKALFDEAEVSRELERDVIKVIGKHDVDEDFKTMVRNPWMWEGISHMLVHLSCLDPNFHPSGRVLAKTSIKYDVHDHGLDVIAIYEDVNIGISAGECKAYFSDPTNGITDASNKLAEVDSSVRDIEIRSAVCQLRSSLSEDTKDKLSGTFWRNERCYIPFVCCDSEHTCDWSRKRLSLNRLAVPIKRKYLLPLSLPAAREKFDKICEMMRAYTAIEE